MGASPCEKNKRHLTMAGIAKTPMICDGVDATTGVGSCLIGTTSAAATVIIVLGGLIGLFFGLWQFFQVRNIDLPDGKDPNATKQLRDEANNPQPDESTGLTGPVAAGKEDEVLDSHFEKLVEIYGYVRTGAESFLMAQYSLCLMFTVVFSIIVLILTSSVTDDKGAHKWDFGVGGLTATSFAVGAITSIISGYLGMTVAVYANARVTVEAVRPGAKGWRGSFNAAFIAGSVMGFALCGLALLMLFVLVHLFTKAGNKFSFAEPKVLFECISGYGLGGSSMALFGRVGGGIFTKAADVGADLSGKVAGVPKRDAAGAIVMKDGQPEMQLFDEDSPYNPATIADNVGDNVGDVAGMGSDLFGSFAEASCAALVISASSDELVSGGYTSLMFPMAVSAAGIVMCMLTSFLATHAMEVSKHQDVEKVLKVQLFVSAVLMTGAVYPIAHAFLPDKFTFQDYKQITTNANDAKKMQECTRLGAWACVVCGLWGGCLIGFITEDYTSHSYEPVREVAMSCNQGGAATNIIYGLALGYLSTIIPIVLLAVNVYVAFSLCGMYGVALAALGMLGTLSTCLSIDVYGPIADNAGGLAEMAEFPPAVRKKTDALDAAGNTTAAIGKGFAIGSAALVSLALYGAFVVRLKDSGVLTSTGVNVLMPVTFAFLLIGAMIPYWFAALTMKSVGKAAGEMVEEVKTQFEKKDSKGLTILTG